MVQGDAKLEQRTLTRQLARARVQVSATRGHPVVGNVRFHLHPLATPAPDSRPAERNAACDEESASRIARDSEPGCGTPVRDDSNPKLASLAGLPRWSVLDSTSPLAAQPRSLEGKRREDSGTCRCKRTWGSLSRQEAHEGEHDDAQETIEPKESQFLAGARLRVLAESVEAQGTA